MYAKATISVIFEHGEGVSYGTAAEHIAAILTATVGNVVAAGVVEGPVEGGVVPMTEHDVVTELGGCGECDTCQEAVSALAASASENAAIERAARYV